MRVKRFAIHQTSKTMAALYALMGVVIVPIFWLVNSIAPPDERLPGWFAVAGPIIYGVCGYIFVAIACAIYNFMAQFTGGIDFEVD